MILLSENLELYLWSLSAIGVAALVGLLIHFGIFQLLQRLARRDEHSFRHFLPKHLRAPSRLLIPALAVRISLPAHAGSLHESSVAYVNIALSTLIIASGAWLLVRLTSVFEDWMLSRYDIKAEDNLSARKIATQMGIVRKIIVFVITILAIAAVLMNFENFRQVGTSLLASAGVAGLVIGFAAQRTIANVLAGFQIALSQPIRIDDVVIVENEWGRIEEITLTYVVVRIWDLRRLIVPISYFIEKPFENWTRSSADMLGTVFIYLDYTVPIDEIRTYLGEILKESEYWDGKVWRLHTTESGERTIELRALMSAASSGDAWELRCEIREKLIGYVQKNYPEALPRLRSEINGKLGADLQNETDETQEASARPS